MLIDVCNGDADGLCAVLQWRLHTPAAATLVTGLKRDIELLERVQAGPGDEVLVCDISLRRNHRALLRLLQAGVRVSYFDHHAVDSVPVHPLLQAHIDGSNSVCSSLLVDRHLGGQHRAWAVVGAFGDNLVAPAAELCRTMGLDADCTARLRLLGEAINYNAYGDTAQDLLMAPQQLFSVLLQYPNPLDFLQQPLAQALQDKLQADLAQAHALEPYFQDSGHGVYLLPDAAWSRRVMGNLCNLLAQQQPQRALAVLRPRAEGGYVVSVRAPHAAAASAAEFCRRFGGDGRAVAAGIDHLPGPQLGAFAEAFVATAWHRVVAGSRAC